MKFLALKAQEKQSQTKSSESKSEGVTNKFFKIWRRNYQKNAEFKKKSKNYFFLNQTK